MIQTARGAETIASSVFQAGFNIGNALGAFLGGLPLVFGFDYASPNLIGVGMSLLGAVAAAIFIKVSDSLPELTPQQKAGIAH